MLMCSAPVYNDVVEEWQHQGQRRRKKKEKKAGDLPSFLRSSQSPERSRKDDLNAYLSGQGAVYGGPEWEAEWNSARFLPDLVTAHHSQVLLPFVKTSEKKRKAKAADESRASMLSKSLDQTKISNSMEQSASKIIDDSAPAQPKAGESETDTSKRPPSASAQAILDKERAHNSRPHSALQTPNPEKIAVIQKHVVVKEQAKEEARSRPPTQARPSSRTTTATAATPTPSRGAAGKSNKPSSPALAGTKSKTSLLDSKPRADASQTAKSGGRKSRLEREGGAAAPAVRGAGGVDSSVVEALEEELGAYKAAEGRLKERIKDKDQQMYELSQKAFYLNDELTGLRDRHEGVLPELERARESNARFDDVKHLLKLSENERVTLMEHIEVLQEENLTWRPLQKKLEERVEHLLHDVAAQAHEIARLQVFETELKAEKDKVAAARIQVQSWQDIAAELQGKCERWEQVNDMNTVALSNAKAEMLLLGKDRKAAEDKLARYEDILEAHGIPLIPEEEREDDFSGDEMGDDALAQPLTSLRTSALLRGQLPASTVPEVDDMTATAGLAQDSILDEPAYGTHERQA